MKKSLIFYIIVFVAGILLPNIVKANELPNFYFKQLSQQDGLVQNYVRSITLDHNGFYWIGTRAGLSRFDGYEFRNYQNEAENKNSLSADMIFMWWRTLRTICGCRHREVWIYTGEKRMISSILHGIIPVSEHRLALFAIRPYILPVQEIYSNVRTVRADLR